MRNFYLTSLMVLIMPMLSMAQVTEYLDSIRANGKTYMTPDYLWKTTDVATLDKQLTRYTKDTNALVVEEAYDIMYHAGISSANLSERQMAMEFVAKGLDGDMNVTSRNISHLEGFLPADINDVTQKILETRLDDWESAYYSRVAKLAARLGIGRLQIRNRQFLDKKANVELKWSMHLALARLGEQTDIDFIVRKASAIPYDYSEDLLTMIVPQLIYTRQKPAIDVCVEMLQTDKCKCASANPTVDVKILCGYRIMEMLAPVIQDYPYKVSKAGMIEADDYEEALTIIREWFRSHPDYTIIAD